MRPRSHARVLPDVDEQEARVTYREVRRAPLTDVGHERPSGAVNASLVADRDIERGVDVIPAVDDPVDRPPSARTVELQRWEGTVEEVGDESFDATLVDMSAPGPDEWVRLPLSEVAAADRDLLRRGAVFYWWMGYRDSASGRERVSRIRFRRLPGLTDIEAEGIRAAAADRAQRFAFD